MTFDPTPVSDYAHHGEDGPYLWWLEVGRFAGDEYPPDPDDDYDPWDGDDDE